MMAYKVPTASIGMVLDLQYLHIWVPGRSGNSTLTHMDPSGQRRPWQVKTGGDDDSEGGAQGSINFAVHDQEGQGRNMRSHTYIHISMRYGGFQQLEAFFRSSYNKDHRKFGLFWGPFFWQTSGEHYCQTRPQRGPCASMVYT